MGRTINILEGGHTPVTEVMFRDSDGDKMSITHSHDNYLQLAAVDGGTELCFSREDIDKFIKLFQAAKEYNI